ncbi:MAG: TolC family protein [bacterium]
MISITGAEDSNAQQLKLTVDAAVLMSLQNNKSLQIQRIEPKIGWTRIAQEKSVFDVNLSGDLSSSMSEEDVTDSKTRRTKEELEISKRLRSGAEITLGLSSENNSAGADYDLYTSQFAISFKALLYRGAGSGVNLVGVKQAELAVKSSNYELRAYAESIIEQVIETYWDYALALREVKIYEDSLGLAKRQLYEAEVMVEIGKLAEIEIVAARAEAALREQGLINVQGRAETLRLKLLRLTNPAKNSDFWDTAVVIEEQFVAPQIEFGSLDSLIETAMKLRPDLNEAKLLLERGELDVVKTRNGLLPYLDFFITLGGTGYAESFGDSFGGVFGDRQDMQIGLNYNVALGRRDEKARYEQSMFKREQYILAIENMELIVQEEVRSAWVEANRAARQIEVAKATLALQEEKQRAETEKFRVGKSTSINVAQAQRDLLQAQVDESKAVADYSKAVINLFRSGGTLLVHYGISVL